MPLATDNSFNACHQASASVMCTPLHGPVQLAIPRGVKLVGYMFLPKLSLSLRGSSPPRNTLFLGQSSLIISDVISIGSAIFVWVLNAMLYIALSMGTKPSAIAPSPLGFRHPAGGGPSHGHRQHPKMVKIARKVPGISFWTQTYTHMHIHTHRRTHHNTS